MGMLNRLIGQATRGTSAARRPAPRGRGFGMRRQQPPARGGLGSIARSLLSRRGRRL